MPMLVKSAFKAVRGGCIHNVIRKIVPSIDDTIAKSICTNIEP